MIDSLKKLLLGACALAALSGCATAPAAYPGTTEYQLDGSEDRSRTRSVIWTVVGVLVVGAILANEASDNIDDAIRSSAQP